MSMVSYMGNCQRKLRLCKGSLGVGVLLLLRCGAQPGDGSLDEQKYQTDLYAVTCGVVVFAGMGQSVLMSFDDRLVKFQSVDPGLCLGSCWGHEVWYTLLCSFVLYLGH